MWCMWLVVIDGLLFLEYVCMWQNDNRIIIHWKGFASSLECFKKYMELRICVAI